MPTNYNLGRLSQIVANTVLFALISWRIWNMFSGFVSGLLKFGRCLTSMWESLLSMSGLDKCFEYLVPSFCLGSSQCVIYFCYLGSLASSECLSV